MDVLCAVGVIDFMLYRCDPDSELFIFIVISMFWVGGDEKADGIIWRDVVWVTMVWNGCSAFGGESLYVFEWFLVLWLTS